MKSKFLKLFNNNDISFSFKQDNQGNSGLFHLLEQIPGYIEVKDLTSLLLKQKYWGSYNRPFFPSIFEKSGYKAMMNRYGNVYSFDNNDRARLIKQKIESIKTIEDFKSLMQTNETEEGVTGVNSISPRYDLMSKTQRRYPKPSGGIDSKITNLEMGKDLTVIAISGPTHQNSAPFNWDNWKNKNYPHYGLPNYWNYDWVKMDINFVKNN